MRGYSLYLPIHDNSHVGCCYDDDDADVDVDDDDAITSDIRRFFERRMLRRLQGFWRRSENESNSCGLFVRKNKKRAAGLFAKTSSRFG